MFEQNKKVELLAPAGNKEAFYGAVHAGADAVYLGGSRFGARAYADNFTETELLECIRYARLLDKKVYLTVNTLLKEKELAELTDYIRPFYEAGLHGVIVQDIGALTLMRQNFPGLELHASTQMTLTGSHGASLLKQMGVCRIVPARELNLNEIRQLKQETGLEVETFIHGAMCYCYSGQCLFSSILGGRSGNRGRCAQPCRLSYQIRSDGESTGECYPLSLKDMCTIEHIPDLINAGIDSFKIEGRMKKPEYAAGVTAIYRKYIDMYYANPDKPFVVGENDLKRLSCLYIRSERQNGYYYKHNGKDMITLKSPAYSKSDEHLLDEIRKSYLCSRPSLPVSITGRFIIGSPACVTVSTQKHSVTVYGSGEGGLVQSACRQPITVENIKNQLGRLGDTPFHLQHVEIRLDEQAFLPLKVLNELRREATALLEEKILNEQTPPSPRSSAYSPASGQLQHKAPKNNIQNNDRKGFVVSVRTFEQLEAALQFGKNRQISRIYIDSDLLLQTDSKLMEQLTTLKETELIAALPPILRMKDDEYMAGLLKLVQTLPAIKGIRVSSIEGLGRLTEYDKSIYADAGLYLWNSTTFSAWGSMLSGWCIPYELNSAEQKALTATMPKDGSLRCEKLFYGRIPMMLTANCVAKTAGKCRQKSGGFKGEMLLLTDRYRKNFPVIPNCRHCMNTIYNSVPLSLHTEWYKWKDTADMRLDFTIETAGESLSVMKFFYELYSSPDRQKVQPPYQNYTTGHEKRGVE